MASLTPRLDRLERNLIINGNFDFWQRGTSFASLSNVNAYTADRFRFETSATYSVTVSRSTDVPTVAQSGFQSLYSMSLVNGTGSSPGATDVVRFRYRMEGFDYQPIHTKSCRLQFWVKTSISGTYTIILANSNGSRNYVTTFSVPSANTWIKIVKDITLDSAGTWLFDSGVGLNLVITLTGGSATQTSTLNTWSDQTTTVSNTQTQWGATTGATFNISQVMLVPGDFSTTDVEIPFQRCGRTVQDELAMCQRYCERLERKTGQQNIIGMAYIINSAVFITHCPYKVPKRTNAVTMSQSAISNQFTLTYNATSQAFNSLALFNETDEFGARVGNSGMAGLTPVSGTGALAFNADGAYIVFDAEL